MSFSPPGPHASAYGSGTVFASMHTPLLLEFPALCVSHTKKPPPTPSVVRPQLSPVGQNCLSERGDRGS